MSGRFGRGLSAAVADCVDATVGEICGFGFVAGLLVEDDVDGVASGASGWKFSRGEEFIGFQRRYAGARNCASCGCVVNGEDW